jgi:hypothetical protein
LYDIDQCPLSLNKRASKLTRVTFGTLAAATLAYIYFEDDDHARQTKGRETDAIPLIYLRSRTMMLAIGCLASAKVRF